MFDTFSDEAIHLSIWHLGLLLFLGTYILEDAAIISGAILSAENVIPPQVAFLVLLAGISSGDFLLYLFGYFAGSRPFMKRWRKSKRAVAVEKWLSSNLFITIFMVRFAPGFRLPCYLASGWLAVSAPKFLLAVLMASILWTGMVFGSLLWLGAPLWEHTGFGNLIFLPVFFAVVYLLQRFFRNHIKKWLEGKSDRP